MTSNLGLSADQLTTLQSISADVAAAVDPMALARHVVHELHTRFGYELPSVYLLRPDGSLHLAAQIGYRQQINTIPTGHGILGRVLRERKSVFVRDAASDPDFRYADPDVKSEVCVPIPGGGQVLGVVNVETRRSDILRETDVVLLEL